MALNLLAYDYTAYGCSQQKTINEDTLVSDLELIINWLKVPKDSIVLWGFSLGSFPTVQVAARHRVGGVILNSPLASGASFFEDSEEECR